jgi:ribosomal protein S12 methylthiotransferase accessory factor
VTGPAGAGPGAPGHPGDTLAALARLLPVIGVTRLADVTGLDVLGVPAAIAVRPLAATATVSPAAAPTPAAAKAAAALAAAALWHAEARVPAPAAAGVPALDLGGEARLDGLGLPPGSLVTSATPLDWVRALPLGGGAPVLVPRDLVRIGPVPRRLWRPGRLAGSPAGLAAAPTREEAVGAALLGLAARDAAAAAARGTDAPSVDLDTVPDPWTARTVRRIRAAGGAVTAAAVPGAAGLARFTVRVALEDTAPMTPSGAAAHPDPAQALRAALAAAARDRLCLIAGIGSACGLPSAGQPRPGACLAWDELPRALGWQAAGAPAAAAAAGSGMAGPGGPPLVVDLLPAGPGIAAVKVLRCGAAA